MVKPMNSQQVDSKYTNRILQQVESDAILPSLDRSVSFEIKPEVTQGDDYVAVEDADDDENQGHVMDDVQDSIAVRRTRKIHVSPVGSLQI